MCFLIKTIRITKTSRKHICFKDVFVGSYDTYVRTYRGAILFGMLINKERERENITMWSEIENEDNHK